MQSLRRDVRFAVRTLRRSPGFATIVILTLGTAIGVNTAVFTVTNAVLFKGFRGIDRNDRIAYIGTQRGGRGCCVSYPDFLDWRRQTHSFSDLAAVADLQVVVADGAGGAEHYDATQISPNAFAILGRHPIIGRDFTTTDAVPGAPPVAVLQFNFWERRYRKDPAVLGRALKINGVPTTIVGVMPEDFAFPQNQDLWLPLVPTPELDHRERRTLWFAFGRLVGGATFDTARAELAAVGNALSVAYPQTNEGWLPQPRTFAEFFVGREATTIYGTLWVAVAFVVLIACANVANLILSQGLRRSREWSALAALGASRWDIVRRQLVESAILASLGGAVGWWIAAVSLRLYETMANAPARAWSAHLFDYGMDGRVLMYVAMVATATTFLVGLWPAIYASRVDVSTALQGAGRSLAGTRRDRRLAAGLIVIEVAAAVVLLVGAGLMVRSFATLARADLGIRSANVNATLVSLPRDRYRDGESQSRFFDRLLAHLRETTALESIALTDELPAANGRRVAYELPTDAITDGNQRDTALTVTVSSGYFATMGATIAAGRDFTDLDRGPGSAVAIVNQRFAESHWRGEDPIGQRVRLFDGTSPSPWLTVVGAASNIAQNMIDRQVKDPLIYRPFSQRPASSFWIVARARPGSALVGPTLRSAIDAIDADVPIWIGPLTLDAFIASMGNYWLLGNNMAMFTAFAIIALCLAALGIYSVVAYAVGRRTKEFGIRLAMGGTSSDILRLVLRENAPSIGAGLLIGLAASLVLAPVLRSQLVRVSPMDPTSLAVASSVLIICALTGCLLPAYRATFVEPAAALRTD